MGQAGQDQGNAANSTSLLADVIDALKKDQPLFLFLLGVGILFLLGGAALETLRLVLLPFSILVFTGIVVWGFGEAGKMRRSKFSTGSVNVKPGATVKKSGIMTGDISGVSGDGQAKTGNVTVGGKSGLDGVKLTTGSIKINPQDNQKK